MCLLFQINNTWSVDSFSTNHPVQSQGYILYRRNTRSEKSVPEIAYTGSGLFSSNAVPFSGDTNFSIFTEPAHQDLLGVKLLISESTYLDDSSLMRQNARKYGHICIQDYADNASLFKVR